MMESAGTLSATVPRYEDLEIPAGDRGTAVSKAEAEFMHALVAGLKPRATLEVGMGYGCSAAFIISAARVPHYAMDPMQADYHHLGLKNLRKLGLDSHLRFFPDYSHTALPRLLSEGVKVDFAFIDGGHRFDDIFIDFYYADLILERGGHILLHDAWMRSTQTVASWVRRNKTGYEAVPTPLKNLILLRKTGEDVRAWNHFRGFATWKSLLSHSLNTLKRRIRGRLPA
ncbi:MAG: O-methyltransferase, family 3 [Fibrobacteres bacterium]|nr:O-methyltransferase, family 3 [Fibrobacterota bacterium]